jgi:hypothetical protein
MQAQVDAHSKSLTRSLSTIWARVVVAVTSLLTMLLAIFGLSSWAEAAAWHHAAQHVLIFSAGAGCSAAWLAKRKDTK